MLNATLIKKQMSDLSKSLDMPKAYKEDLDQDYSIINKAETESNSNEYIWILRPTGTCLIPLFSGVNPVHVEAWGNVDNIFFHVVGDSVNRISYDFAYSLINEFPFNPAKLSSFTQLMDKMDSLLSSSVVQSSAFEVINLNSAFSSWAAWQDWFKKTDNTMMADFMAKAIKQNSLLSKLRLVA